MSFRERYLLIDDQDNFHFLTSASCDRLFTGKERLPQFAGIKVRTVRYLVEFEGGVATRVDRLIFERMQFTKSGSFDKKWLLQAARERMDASGFPDIPVESERPKANVIDAGRTFARKRLRNIHEWSPSDRLYTAICIAINRKTFKGRA
ncbi:hypothetical protein L0222_29115 [bacterium]|nr:hypothetical protein [bacterium]MCI0603536.1 hypothetical protein [bacterium]